MSTERTSCSKQCFILLPWISVVQSRKLMQEMLWKWIFMLVPNGQGFSFTASMQLGRPRDETGVRDREHRQRGSGRNALDSATSVP